MCFFFLSLLYSFFFLFGFSMGLIRMCIDSRGEKIRMNYFSMHEMNDFFLCDSFFDVDDAEKKDNYSQKF